MNFRYFKTQIIDTNSGLDDTFNHLAVIDNEKLKLFEYFRLDTLEVINDPNIWNEPKLDFSYQLRYDMRTWLDNNIGVCNWIFNSGMMGIQFKSEDHVQKFMEFWNSYE